MTMLLYKCGIEVGRCAEMIYKKGMRCSRCIIGVNEVGRCAEMKK